ncbi:MAG: VOC family protein [Pseudomonadota bacterium]
MIDHVSLGVSDMDRSLAFYRAVLAPLELRCLVDLPGRAGFGKRYPEFWILARLAMERVPADSANHLALRAPSEAAVRDFHAAALEFGGRSGGLPGLRAYTMANAYAAFIRDPDGNRVEAMWVAQTTKPTS